MPFTFSHPAAVLPLHFLDRKRLSVTALVIGSMTPDFEYFFNFKQESTYSHTWLGILWFDLPIAILLFYLYTNAVKDELIDHLPTFLYRRFARCKSWQRKSYSLNAYFKVLSSLLIGITSHLIWDRLTHKSVRLIANQTEYYQFLWDLNSLIGFIMISFLVWRTAKSKIVNNRDIFFYWFFILSINLCVVVIRVTQTTSLSNLGVGTISGFLMGLLIISAINKLRNKKSDERIQQRKEQPEAVKI